MLTDLRFALRMLLKDWTFSAVAILTLALAIGANTAIFTVVDGVLLRPLDYPASDRLVAIHENVPKFANLAPLIPVNAMHFNEWVKRGHAFDQMTLIAGAEMDLTGTGDPQRVPTARVSPALFSMLGISPQIGRTLLPEEAVAGRERVVVIDASLWRSRFSADPKILGTKIMLNGIPHEIVGVLPDNFHFPKLSHLFAMGVDEARPMIWQPIVFRQDELEPLGDFNFAAIARLRSGVSPEQAQAEMDAILEGLLEKQPERIEVHAKLVPLQDQITGKSRAGLRLMLAAVGVVLLIACVNIANLLLARSAQRRREIAVRRAVGASGARLVRQVVVESLTLSCVGGALGVAVAWGMLQAILANLPPDMPRANEIHLDARVLVFTMAISVVAGLLFAIVPAMRFARTDPQEALKSGSRGSTAGRSAGRLRWTLVAVEVGLSAVCLIAGGLLLHSFVKLMRVDPGFRAERVMTTSMNLPYERYHDDVKVNAFWRSLLTRVQSLPGVAGVGLSSKLPLSGEGSNNLVQFEGQNVPFAERPLVDFRETNTDFFRVMGIPLLAGHIYTESVRERREILVSAQTALRLWPGQDPLGKRLHLGGDTAPLLEVCGVVGDVRGVTLGTQPRFTIYLPFWQRSVHGIGLVVRTQSNPQSAASGIRAAVHEGDPELPLAAFQTMEEIVAGSVAQRRFQMNLVLLFGGAALLLASLGIYGVVSYTVTQRTSEIGIRMALGAQPGGIRRMVLGQGLKPVIVGLAAGVAGSFALGRVLATLLYDVGASDPATIAGVAGVLVTMAAAAILIPARRAMRVDPAIALRDE